MGDVGAGHGLERGRGAKKKRGSKSQKREAF